MSILTALPDDQYILTAFARFSAADRSILDVARAMMWLSQLAYESDDKKKIELPDPNMTVVSGKVTLKGMPLNYGFVTFVDGDGRQFSANIRKDGTYAFKKGFPPGEYKVEWHAVSDDTHRVKGNYSFSVAP